MKWLGPVAVMLAAALVGVSAARGWAADDKDRPFGGPPPQRSTEERPFGGPPPNDRGNPFKKQGRKCGTAAGICALAKARPVGTVCTCPEGDDKGSQGKVE